MVSFTRKYLDLLFKFVIINIFYTFYAHMRDNSICVEQGQIVEEGQVVGTQGSTGNSTGDHVHFEIRLADKSTIDPAPYLFREKEG